VRDALYQSLLTAPRAALHLRIAEEIEGRSSNRLVEVAETLAHHYSCASQATKAFEYLALAGQKALAIYSLEEAGSRFSSAVALLAENPDCADDLHVAAVVANCALYRRRDRHEKLLYRRAPSNYVPDVVGAISGSRESGS
jgi:predicted ATPase